MSSVTVHGLAKHFGGAFAVRDVDLAIADGEFLCVLGPSGCGKTTLLRLLAGLERADAGTIAFDEEVVSGLGRHVPPEERRVGVVFQSYALWPHMSVAENVAYPLRVAKVGEGERRQRVRDALAAVRLEDYAERPPHALSGGQQQRVALARCLVARPRLVLMDEPLASLDMHLREGMLAEFTRFHRETGATILYITHDQAEAMSIADRIAVMQGGRILQLAAPELLYREPASGAVAAFIGLSGLVEGEVVEAGEVEATVRWTGGTLPARIRTNPRPGQRVVLCIRPEQLVLGDGEARGTVTRVVYLGERYLVEISVRGATLRAYSATRVGPGEQVPFRITGAFAMREEPASVS